MDKPQLPQAGVDQAQAAIDAENHAAPLQEQAQPEVQATPNTETVPAPTSLLEVIFIFFLSFSLVVHFLFKFGSPCCGLLVVAP